MEIIKKRFELSEDGNEILEINDRISSHHKQMVKSQTQTTVGNLETTMLLNPIQKRNSMYRLSSCKENEPKGKKDLFELAGGLSYGH